MGIGYLGGDYPNVWPLPPLEMVHMTFENTVHYAFDSELGDAEWNATLPLGGTTLYLGPSSRPFTLSLFHQLRCINIIRKELQEYYANNSPTAEIGRPALVEHCMNYLRQMVLCSSDLHLESVRAPKGNHLTVPDVTHKCRDWNPIYEAAENNYWEYKKRSRNTDANED
ncbi:hypothetical protein M422DRAFT_168394 [Sphaerobolus stellatus SS14]|uniref:Uncharacterized protein n=1 Tax=Sphaerobolus stellatus (strain SS14) TaxID=990650 RepID=A0A0C9VQ15_SPHS4|nr:hypothetical protein M422DRAFT_168394 [Sphaerobolus stellatus SS14]